MRATASSLNDIIWYGTIGRLLKQVLKWRLGSRKQALKSQNQMMMMVGGLGDGVVFTKRYQKILKIVCLQVET